MPITINLSLSTMVLTKHIFLISLCLNPILSDANFNSDSPFFPLGDASEMERAVPETGHMRHDGSDLRLDQT